MKLLLTGPTGFIGSAFVRLALSRGHEIAGLLIPAEDIPASLPPNPNLHWLRGTLEQAPWREIEAFGPEACIHMAWITTPGMYLESPENDRFRDASLSFLRRMPEAGARYLLGLGSCIEYQIGSEPLSEERTPLFPTTRYARCKNQLRLALERDAGDFGFGWARVFYPYGPGEHPSRLCSSIAQKFERGEKVLLKTPSSTKDYIFIEDLAAALLAVVENKVRGPINVGTGTGSSVREIAGRLACLMGKPLLVEEADPPEPDPFPFVVADATKLRSLGWEPQFTMEQGLKRLVEVLMRS